MSLAESLSVCLSFPKASFCFHWSLLFCGLYFICFSMIFIVSFLMLTLGFVFSFFLVPLGSRLGVYLRFFLFLEEGLYHCKLSSGNAFVMILKSCVFIFICLKAFSDFFIDPLNFLLRCCLVSTGLRFPSFFLWSSSSLLLLWGEERLCHLRDSSWTPWGRHSTNNTFAYTWRLQITWELHVLLKQHRNRVAKWSWKPSFLKS